MPKNEKLFREKMGCVFCEYYQGRICTFEKYGHKCPFMDDLKESKKYTSFVKVGLGDSAKIGQEAMKLRKAGIVNG